MIQQIFSADLLSRSFQQIFSADFLQQIFSADLLSRSSQQIFSQQIFSADLLSRFFQQIFSADLLSRFSSADLLSRSSQQIFSADFLSADFLSRSSQQIFSADLLSRSSQQIFSLSYHLLWSGVGGQLLSYHSYHLLWSGVGGQLLSYHLLWSGVGGQLLSYHVGGLYCMSSLEGPFRGAFGKKINELNEDKPNQLPLFSLGYLASKRSQWVSPTTGAIYHGFYGGIFRCRRVAESWWFIRSGVPLHTCKSKTIMINCPQFWTIKIPYFKRKVFGWIPIFVNGLWTSKVHM